MRAIIAFIILTSVAYAKDFGVQGHTFSIAEENIMKIIEARLQKIDMEKLNAQMKERTQKYIERPKAVEGITTATESKLFYYDPTYTAPESVIDPTGRLICTKGERINPLELVPLRDALIFIDGDDEKQVQFALKMRTQKENKLKVILVKGSPLKLQKQHKVWIYFDQAGVISKQLGITTIPALVEQDGLKLKISITEVEKL